MAPSIIRVLETKHLRLLQQVAQLGSFAAAADALCYTPSAVSQQIAALERDAGCTLFARQQGGARLTEEGEALLVRAEAILTQLTVAEAELRELARRRGGRLRFGSFTSATATFTAAALERFHELHPAVAVEFFDGEPYESAARLKAGELDLAVVFDFDAWPVGTAYDGQAVCDDGALDCVALFDDPYLLVAPRDHPLAARDVVPVDDLSGETIIGCSPWIDALAAAWATEPRPPRFDRSCHATGFEAFQALVAAGRGLTLMPELALRWRRADLISLPLEGAPVRHVKAATRAGTHRSPVTQTMLDLLVGLVRARRHEIVAPVPS